MSFPPFDLTKEVDCPYCKVTAASFYDLKQHINDSHALEAYTVRTYRIVTPKGKHIRMATKVIRHYDGREVRFTEKLGKKEAIKNAIYWFAKKDSGK